MVDWISGEGLEGLGIVDFRVKRRFAFDSGAVDAEWGVVRDGVLDVVLVYLSHEDSH